MGYATLLDEAKGAYNTACIMAEKAIAMPNRVLREVYRKHMLLVIQDIRNIISKLEEN